LPFPDISEALPELNHQLVVHTQRIPATVEAGGAERIVSLSDLVWFKCKVSFYRGIVTQLTHAERDSQGLSLADSWWIGAAGVRQGDSASDFYKQIQAEADRRGKGTGRPDTAHLLPQEIDRERLQAERSLLAVKALRNLILAIIADSLRDGKTHAVQIGGHTVIAAIVRASDGSEAYLAVSAEGFIRAEILAIILSSVPGVQESDWQPEPGGAAGITPKPGQIIWSTFVPPEAQAQILEI
jgi:hypothetical protein